MEAIYDSSKTVYTYDGAGHRTKEEKYDSMVIFLREPSLRMTRPGIKPKDERYGPDGKTLTGWSTFKFDLKGLLVEEDVFDAKGECTYLTKTT